MNKTTNLEKHTTKNPIGRFFLNNFLSTVVDVVKPLNPQSILDVGCGEGFTLFRLEKEKIGEKLEGIDAVGEAIDIGKKLHPNLTLKTGDVYNLRYEDDSFDVVLCTEVLEHLEFPRKALKELIRVSQKYVLITVPNEPFFTWQRILRGKNILKLGAHPEHIQHWSAEGFEKFVKREKSLPAGRQVKITAKRHPFPWTMLLLRK